MKVESETNMQVKGTPILMDKTLNQAYINALKKHIVLLEAKKHEAKNAFSGEDMPAVIDGFIKGLDYAINTLNENINQLNNK